MTRTNRAIGYRRLSDKDQSKYSLAHQDEAIKNYCSRNGLELINMFTDNGECSDTFDRADYRALEAFIKKNKGEAGYLIVMHHDRFSRNLPEALMKIDELESKYRIKVLATSEDVNLDTKDPAVFMQRAFNYLMANSELLRIRQRTKDGIRMAQSQGRFVNVAPFGYINARDAEGKSVLLIDDAKALIVKMVFEEYLLGTPIYLIYDMAKKMGFTRTGNSAIHNLLNNSLYAGLVKVNGDRKNPDKLVKGIHQPIIKEADYWLAQEYLGNKRPSKTQPRDEFPLRGILKCWCGNSMTAGYSKGRKQYYLYYRCTVHGGCNIPGNMLHEKFEELLQLLSFSQHQVDHIRQRCLALLNDATKNQTTLLASREKQLKDIANKIDKLEERLMNDEINADTYKKWQRKFSQDKALLFDEIESSRSGQREQKLKKLNRLLPLMSNIRMIYSNATLSRKQSLIRGVFKHNLTYVDGTFRTASIEPAFRDNALIANKKGLLEIEEAKDIWDEIPSSTQKQIRTATPLPAPPPQDGASTNFATWVS